MQDRAWDSATVTVCVGRLHTMVQKAMLLVGNGVRLGCASSTGVGKEVEVLVCPRDMLSLVLFDLQQLTVSVLHIAPLPVRGPCPYWTLHSACEGCQSRW